MQNPERKPGRNLQTILGHPLFILLCGYYTYSSARDGVQFRLQEMNQSGEAFDVGDPADLSDIFLSFEEGAETPYERVPPAVSILLAGYCFQRYIKIRGGQVSEDLKRRRKNDR